MQQTAISGLSLDHQEYRRELGDGLLLRWSTPEDVESLIAMYRNVYRPKQDAPPNPLVGHWVHDMASGRHPHTTGYDFALVEDTRSRRVVAATCLLSQMVSYQHIPLMLGRPEIVATEIEYRKRGLQRAIFSLIHARSEARGHLMQGITGITFFYRQFGYEFALDLEATRHVYFAALPARKESDPVPCLLRPAVVEDIPFLIALSERERAGWQVATVLGEAEWHWMAFGCNPAAANLGLTYILTTPEGAAIGYILLNRIRSRDSVGIWGMAVKEGVSLAAVAPYTLSALREIVAALPSRPDDAPPPARFRLEMGNGHALFEALGPELALPTGDHYAWWIRIPDMPAFIRHIAPALEERLSHSAFAGHSGELCIDFYRGGLRLVFADGRLITTEDWQKPFWDETQAACPRPIFAQLALGYRSFADLAYAHVDVRAERAPRLLLETLFPARPSTMVPLD